MTLDPAWFTDLDELPIPDWVRQFAGAQPVQPVWRNEDGGVTYRLNHGRSYLKTQRPGIDWHPDAEALRLAWIGEFVAAPELLASGQHGDQHWLLTRGLPGRSAVDHPWRDRPAVTVPLLGRALRRFHETVPLEGCPFDWSVGHRVQHCGLDEAFVRRAPPLDAVVCHGDACNPNFLINDDGVFGGYVDLGGLGVADRWADLAPALLSLGWNFGPGWEPAFLGAYGIVRDDVKLAFYTALWNGVSDELDRRPPAEH